MRSKILYGGEKGGGARWMLVFDIGDTVVAELERFAREHGLEGAHFTGVGAFSDVVLRYYDWQRKQYEDIPLDEQVEVLAATGNIALHEGKPVVHAHVVLGRFDASTRGGHLKEAHVRPTLELVLTEDARGLSRRRDEATGLTLLEP